jgi:hypothetical protein
MVDYIITEEQLKRYEQGDRFAVANEIRHNPIQGCGDGGCLCNECNDMHCSRAGED